MADPNDQRPGGDLPGGIANAEMATAWDGEEGERWAAHAERFEASIQRHGERLIEAARIGPSDDVLDVGCGCGQSTRQAARLASAGQALGLDLSTPMLARARERARAEGLTNVRFVRGDAQVYPFEPAAFDLVISRFGVMFFTDPVAAFGNIGRALRPGARLAMLVWQELGKNAWVTTLRDALAMGRTLPEPPPGAPGPFGLADPSRVRRILGEAGFTNVDLADVHEPFYVGADAEDAYRFARVQGLTKGLLEELDEPTRVRALERLREAITAHAGEGGVLLASRAWLITARRP